MGDKVRIPRTINAAEKRLTEIGGLVTATEWERAAIVSAYVLPQQGKRTDTSDSSVGSLTVEQFAALGLHGLKSHVTVRAYVRAWLDIVDEDGNVVGQRERPRPGTMVEVPSDPWPPTRTGTDGDETETGAAKRARQAASKHPQAAAAAATATPAARRAAKKAIEAEESQERQEKLEKAGISPAQREARRAQKEQERRESQKRGNEAAGEDWEEAEPSHRGVGLLGHYVHAAESGVEGLLEFLQKPIEETGADWRDHNAVASAVDRLDDTQGQLADCIALLEAALASLRPMTTADFE